MAESSRADSNVPVLDDPGTRKTLRRIICMCRKGNELAEGGSP
jgi:hypothetical protein